MSMGSGMDKFAGLLPFYKIESYFVVADKMAPLPL
jgi:hypothetical protein